MLETSLQTGRCAEQPQHYSITAGLFWLTCLINGTISPHAHRNMLKMLLMTGFNVKRSHICVFPPIPLLNCLLL